LVTNDFEALFDGDFGALVADFRNLVWNFEALV